MRPPAGACTVLLPTLDPARKLADIRIIAGSPETARQIADVLHNSFADTEQRSYATGEADGGTRLHLTVDTALTPDPPGPPAHRHSSSIR